MKNRVIVLVYGLLCCSRLLVGQDIIQIKNGSFESEVANINTVPKDWESFSSDKEGYPDLLPGEYQINAVPKEGKLFVGLRTRRENIYEGMGQQLATPLRKDSTYQWNVWLAHASKYIVPTVKKGKQNGKVTCNGITKLRVLGINSVTHEQELLAETDPVNHAEWRNYSLSLNPKRIECDQIILAAYYNLGNFIKQGNLLIDNCSDIKKVDWNAPFTFADWDNMDTSESVLLASDQIVLKNPSFEFDLGATPATPKFWDNLGSKNQSPTDIQPGLFEVVTAPQQGKHYLGMVARATGTWEAIGQKLQGKLTKKTSYSFKTWLARSAEYESMVPGGEFASFNNPIRLQIWGINKQTSLKEILATSDPITNENWREYNFTLTPAESDIDYIVLEAFWDLKGNKAYNGNLLMDNCSAIVKIQN